MDHVAEIDFGMSLHGVDKLVAVIVELFAGSSTEVVFPGVARLIFGWHVCSATNEHIDNDL